MAEQAKQTTVHELEVHGIKFTVDTDRLDDVDTLDIIDRIESQGRTAAIIPLLKIALGEKSYAKLREDFIKFDAEEHAKELADAGKPEDKDYKPRMRTQKMLDVYMAIAEKFNPKA